jgi:simple sugar transport system ATP-binding protein
MTQNAPLLSCRGLTKRFGPFTANEAVDLDLFAGRVHALLGENGAGKSTLMHMLSGRYRPDAGQILLSGRPVRFASPAQSLRRGIGMVHQRFLLVEPLTVAENLSLSLGRLLPAAEVRALSERFGVAVDPQRRVEDLSMGERQRVEILKLLAREASVLILDEPTSVLVPEEARELYALLRALALGGRAVVFISHKLEEIGRTADEVTVLRRGRVVARNLAPASDLDPAELARLMTGSALPEREQAARPEPGELVFAATGLAGGEGTGFSGVDLQVRKGEILAVVGVAGNGQEALAAALGGVRPFAAGEIAFLGRSLPARRWGGQRGSVAYVPEDRHGRATAPDLDLVDNFLLTSPCGAGLLPDFAEAERRVRRAMEEFRIAASGPGAKARQLSGGNLQKFILAREMDRRVPLLVAEQPTQGLDVAALAEIQAALRRAARDRAVILFTGDPEEALALGSRVGVMYRGRLTLCPGGSGPQALERLGRLMAGLEAA